MENIARIIGADVAEYTDGKDRSGLLGRSSAGQISIRTKENDYIKESNAYAETLF